jgi:adhesin/invasin
MRAAQLCLAALTLVAIGCGSNGTHSTPDPGHRDMALPPDFAGLPPGSGDMGGVINQYAPDPAESTVSVDRATDVVADGGDKAIVTVTVRNAAGMPMFNQPVQLAVSGKGPSFLQPKNSGLGGTAVTSLTATVAETETVTAKVQIAGNWVPLKKTVTVTFIAGAANKLSFSVQPSPVQVGTSITPAVQVSVLDLKGNVVTQASLDVTISTCCTGQVAGTTTVTSVKGIATFSNIQLTQVGNVTLTATATGLLSDYSKPFQVTVGKPAKLAFLSQPQNASSATSLPAVTVALEDEFGNVNSAANGNVTIALKPGEGTGTLSGTLTVATIAGVATFSDLSIDKVGTYYLLGSADGYQGATSNAFSISAGAPTGTTISATPSTVLADGQASTTLLVTTKDAAGNIVPYYHLTIDVTGSNNFLSYYPWYTGSDGTLTATLRSSTAETKTASVHGIDGATTNVQFVHCAVTASPSPVTVGTATTVTLAYQGTNGAPEAGHVVVFDATGTDNTFSSKTATTGDDGKATVTLTSTVAQYKNVTAKVDDQINVGTNVQFTADVPAALKLEPYSYYGLPITAGQAVYFVATVTDRFNNPATGASITFQAPGFIAIPSPATANGDGKAYTTIRNVDSTTPTKAGTISAIAIDSSGEIANAKVDIVAGAANGNKSSLVPTPATLPADGTTTSTITITLADAYGNPLKGQALSPRVVGVGGQLTPASGSTGDNGLFTTQLTGTTAGDATVVVNVGGLTLATPVTFTAP